MKTNLLIRESALIGKSSIFNLYGKKQNLRAFIAIELPRDFIGEVADIARQLRAAVPGRYVPRENYHVTLAFLGDIAASQIDEIANCMDASLSKVEKPIRLKPDGIGKFGKSKNAMLWLGLNKAPEMMDLALRLRDNLAQEGISFDDKSFLPHITLAHHAQIPDIELPALVFPESVYADRMVLYKSTLSKEGASYEALCEMEFNI